MHTAVWSLYQGCFPTLFGNATYWQCCAENSVREEGESAFSSLLQGFGSVCIVCVCVCAVLYFYVLLLPLAIFHLLLNKGWPDQCKSFFVAFLGLIVCFSGNEMFIFYISQGSPRLIQTPIWGIRELTLDCIGIRNRCAYCHLLILAYILILILPPL